MWPIAGQPIDEDPAPLTSNTDLRNDCVYSTKMRFAALCLLLASSSVDAFGLSQTRAFSASLRMNAAAAVNGGDKEDGSKWTGQAYVGETLGDVTGSGFAGLR